MKEIGFVKYYLEGNFVCLKSAHQKEPYRLEAKDVHIQGVLIKLIRLF